MANQLLIQAPKAELTREETVIVPILLRVESPLKVRGIHARFWGAEEAKADYTTTSTDDKGNTTTHHHTAVQYTNFVDQASVLAGDPPRGFWYSVGDALATLAGGGKHEVLQPGEYPFEMQIAIPSDAPPTYAGRKSRVFYELSAWVDIPAAIDLKAAQAFVVTPLAATELPVNPVRVCYPDDACRGFWDSLLGPDVQVELALSADAARPGDTIEGLVVIESQKPLTLKALRASCVGVESTQAQGHRDAVHYASPAIEFAHPGEVQGRYSQEFTLPIELVGPPTLAGTNVRVDWFVQVELDVPWSKDPKIRAPIRLSP